MIMRFVTKALNDSGLVFGVFDTKRDAFEVNPKTNKNFTFARKDKADEMVKVFNDAATAEAKAKTAARVAKAKATRARNKGTAENRPSA